MIIIRSIRIKITIIITIIVVIAAAIIIGATAAKD